MAKTNTEILEIMKVVEQEYGKYFRSLGLKESKAKQMHIIFSKEKNSKEEFKLNDRASEKSTRLLGVTVSEDWTFDEHASKVCQRMMERIPHIRAIRENVSRKVLIRISRSLVLSIYEFACEFTLLTHALQKRVQKVYNILLRVITFSDITRSIESMLKETDMMNVALTLKYYCVWSIERLLKERNADYPYNLIDWDYGRGRYNTRYNKLHIYWRPKRALGQRSWIITSINTFNYFNLFNTNWAMEKDEAKSDLQDWLKTNFRNANLK